jgi:hypothetical protein
MIIDDEAPPITRVLLQVGLDIATSALLFSQWDLHLQNTE